MKTPENSWFQPLPPDNEVISETWHELLIIAQDELSRYLQPASPELQFIGRCSIHNLHACITTAAALTDEDDDFISNADEMPSFMSEAVDEKDETHFSNEPGGLLMHEVDVTIDELSELRLEMAFRDIKRRIITAGILNHRYHAIDIPHAMGIKIVQQLGRYRQVFADILLYQLAGQIAQEDIDEEYEDAEDLASIIHTHLDMPNVREFHSLLRGT